MSDFKRLNQILHKKKQDFIHWDVDGENGIKTNIFFSLKKECTKTKFKILVQF